MKTYKLNKSIAIFVFILLIPFMVVCTYTWLYIDYSSNKEFKTTLSRFTANASKGNIETPLNEIKLIFRSLSASIDETDIEKYLQGQPTDLNTLIPAITDSTIFFSNVIVSDSNDNYKIYPNLSDKKISPRSRPWYPLTATKDVITYSQPYESILDEVNGTAKSKKESITASMNLFNKRSEFIGNIGFDLDLKSISSTINNKLPPYNGKFLITSSAGEIILSENKAEILKKRVPHDWVERGDSVEGDFYDSKQKVFVFYKTYVNPDWYAFTIVNESEYRNITNYAKQSFWIVMLCCLVFYLFVIFFARLYMEKILSRLYMGMNGIIPKKNKLTIGSIYENIRKNKQNLDKAIRDATLDGLTNLFNRRKFDDDIRKLADSGKAFYLAIIDIDNFKAINDTWGHDAGDNVLKVVGQTGCQVVGGEHHIYRFGGEELCVIYSGEDHDLFCQMMDTWLQMVSLRKWREPSLQVTFSGGIAKHMPHDPVEAVLKKADAKMYQAKVAGKNRILF